MAIPAENRRPGCLLILLAVALLGLVVYAFQAELLMLWTLVTIPFRQASGQRIDLDLQALVALTTTLLLFIFGLVLVLFLVSQVVLPAATTSSRIQALYSVLNHSLGQHGPFWLVRLGRLDSPVRGGSGVALIDLSSTIVLERQPAPGRSRSQPAEAREAPQPPRKRPGAAVFSARDTGQQKLPERLFAGRRLTGDQAWLAERRPAEPARSPLPVRVEGAGVIHVIASEKLRGVADLRKQVRTVQNVHAYTSEGIEIETNLSVIFTLGQVPDVIKVTGLGERPQDLRVLQVDEVSGRITGLHAALDEQDLEEIHRFATGFLARRGPRSLPVPESERREAPPFALDKQRIFAAVYSQVQTVQPGSFQDWTALPAEVAVDLFRDLLAQTFYDDLYLPEDPYRFPLKEDFKPRFVRTLQSLGVLSYQYVARRDGAPVQIGQVLDKNSFYFAPVQPLNSPQSFNERKVLRERGIKIISADFSELAPVNPAVRQQRLEAWRARWQREVSNAQSELEAEAARLRRQASEQARGEIAGQLMDIFQVEKTSLDILGGRLFQALQNATSDPLVREQLSAEATARLQALGDWLLSGENGRLPGPDEPEDPPESEPERSAGSPGIP